ncbi:hypothetical protein GCM10010449_81270 [Streptomyces rectiviolaceus]|uniref:Uncharacterized protein n=1 Tax=Streptomyces rectiviolaceus TaxID=332591 RepID=A0ABP6NJM8_9ACTN
MKTSRRRVIEETRHRSLEWFLRNGCPGTDQRSALTPDNSENTTYAVWACQPWYAVAREGYRRSRDYACAHPAVVGRLTAAVHTHVPNGCRLGGRFLFLPLEDPEPGRRAGGPEQEVER